jgi:hypothetical protein
MLRGVDSDLTVPWSELNPSGSDAEKGWGNLWGDTIGDAPGAGGLTLSGIGEGAGGNGVGVGINGVGDCDGFCPGLNGGFGRDVRLGSKGYTPKEREDPRMGEGDVSGRLPPEVIQRVVRNNFGRFRACYEAGLRKNPNLQGRVAVRFVINREGGVANAANAGSDLPDSGVVSCVVSTYYSLSFPAPDNGIVTVSYPISFSPT